MDILQIVLRILHIGAAIFWVGSSAFLHFFIEPTVKALGPQGGAFITHMAEKKKLPIFISVAGVITILAGLLLYADITNGFDPDVITTSPGLAFTVGGIAAIIAFVIGVGVVRPKVVRLGQLGSAMASGTPKPEQVAEMGALQHTLHRISTLNLVLLAIATVAMASARYL